MKYTLTNGKVLNIPDKEIEKIASGLGVNLIEAVQIWLEDNEYEINEEQEALDKTAKNVKVDHQVDRQRKKSEKPRTVHVSDEKKVLFEAVRASLERFCAENEGNCQILKENKLFEVKIGEKTFKIDLIEQRPPKK